MRLAPLSVLALALGLFAGTSAIRAEDVATGKISGKVVDKDGAAVAGAVVMARPQMDKKAKGTADGGVKKAGGDKPGAKPEGFSAKTDDAGAFTIENLPAGTYAVMARGKMMLGKAGAPVVVKAGETADAGTIKMSAVEAKPMKEGVKPAEKNAK